MIASPDGSLDFADPEAAKGHLDPKKANELEDDLFAVRQTNKRLEQEVEGLQAWKERTSDWEEGSEVASSPRPV